MKQGLVCASVCVVLLAASAAAPSLAGAKERTADRNDQATSLVKALAALEKGQADRAIAIYDRLVNTRKLSPELLARALLNRGLAHQRLGHLDAAITDYDAAMRIDALSARARVTALYNRALAYRARGDAGRAIEDLTAALYIDPAFAPAYFARGNILHERGLYYLALADYDQALANGHPSKHRVHYARALLFSALNSLPRTKEALYAALREKPDFAPARQRLAAILRGNLPKTRLFADLVKHRQPAKRITARITPAAGSAAAETNIRTASVMIVGAPVLNVRKTPQRAATVPPTREGRTLALDASASQRKPWRVATLQTLPPVPAPKTEPKKQAGQQAIPAKAVANAARAGLHTASISAAGRLPNKPQARAATQVSGWAIQLSSQRSEEAARNHWSKLRTKVRRRVRKGKVDIARAEIPGKGIYYRLRLVGFSSRVEAKQLCRGLKRGRISCLVVRAGG